MRYPSIYFRKFILGIYGPGNKLGYDWYVDSVSGSDSNDGTDISRPFASLAKLSTAWQPGDTAGLAKGSEWRETLSVPAGASLFSYGAGNRPIVNGADVQANAGFSKTGGLTFVYQIGVTTEGSTTDQYINALEDNVMLARASNTANCDATAGSYYVSAEFGAITLYVHATDDSDITANGKIYECTVRNLVIGGTTFTMNGVHTKNNKGGSGSVVGTLVSVNDCKIANGGKHNMYCNEASLVVDCVFENANYSSSANYLVFNQNTPTGLGGTVSGCSFTSTRPYSINYGGVYSHNNISGSFGNIYITNCTFTNVNICIAMDDVATCYVTSCDMIDCTQLVRNNGSENYEISLCTVSGSTGILFGTGSNGTYAYIHDCTYNVASLATNGAINLFNDNCTVLMEDCTLNIDSGTNTTGVVFNQTAKTTNSLTMNRCSLAINGSGTFPNIHRFLGIPTYVGDFNTYNWKNASGFVNSNYGGVSKSTLADWQAAVAPQDANSVTI